MSVNTLNMNLIVKCYPPNTLDTAFLSPNTRRCNKCNLMFMKHGKYRTKREYRTQLLRKRKQDTTGESH